MARLEAGVCLSLCVVTPETVTVVSISAEQPGPGSSMQRCGAGPGSAVHCTLARQRERVLQTGTEAEENNV